MHSKTYKGIEDGPWTIHHNGDYSGDVVITINTYHPNRTYSERIDYFTNVEQRASMQRLIHAPEDLAPDGYEVKIPYELMERIVADKIRMDMMEKVEQMDEKEILAIAVRNLF